MSAQRLGDFRLRELTDEVSFLVFAESSDPHEVGHLVVRMTPRGVQLRDAGSDGPMWSGDWQDFRAMLARFADEADAARKEFAERRAVQELRESAARDAEMRAEIASGRVVMLPRPVA